MVTKRQNVKKKTGAHLRATFYLSPDIHKALRLRAAESGNSISQLVNSIIKTALAEDAEDFDAFLLHRDEKVMTFESFICDLRRRGRL